MTNNEEREEIIQEIEILSRQIAEIEMVIKILEEIENLKAPFDCWINVFGGIFLRGKIEDNKRILINVGQNVFLEKDIDEVIQGLKEQKEEMEKYLKNLEQQLKEK